MARKDFQLIGHDNPLGYPAPVVPIGFIQDRLVAIYASDRATEIYLDDGEREFIKHSDSLKDRLKKFDYQNDRLFGFSKREVDLYAIDRESEYFTGLLANPSFSSENPFMRLSLAKAIGDGDLLMREIGRCAIHVQNTVPGFTDNWYEKQRQMLAKDSNSFSGFFLPDTKQDLFDLLTFTITTSARETHRDEPSGSNITTSTRETHRDEPPGVRIKPLQILNNAELRLWERFGQGEETARKELVLYYLPLVDNWASRISKSAGWANWKDLRQDGVMGLLKAIDRFDPNRGVEFKYFARSYICGSIYDGSELMRDLVHQQEEISRKVKRAEAELIKTLQRIPTTEEVAERIELPVEKLRNTFDLMGIPFAEAILDSGYDSAMTMNKATQTEIVISVQDALSQLSEREALVLRYYYLEDQSPQEIAEKLGLTVDKVTTTRQNAIIKLREQLDITRKGERDEEKSSGK